MLQVFKRADPLSWPQTGTRRDPLHRPGSAGLLHFPHLPIPYSLPPSPFSLSRGLILKTPLILRKVTVGHSKLSLIKVVFLARVPGNLPPLGVHAQFFGAVYALSIFRQSSITWGWDLNVPSTRHQCTYPAWSWGFTHQEFFSSLAICQQYRACTHAHTHASVHTQKCL